MKVAPAVTFEVDQVFEQAAHVDQLLREIQRRSRRSDEQRGRRRADDDEPETAKA